MIYEINLWLNPGHKYNGSVNTNRGEQVAKFNRLVSFKQFVEEGIAKRFATEDEFNEWESDKEALYTWLPEVGEFLMWNTTQTFVSFFRKGDLVKIPMNKTYSAIRKGMPTVSFRVEV